MVADNAVPKSRMVAHINHLESVDSINPMEDSVVGQMMVRGRIGSVELAELRKTFGWEVCGIGEGAFFIKPSR